MKEQIIDFLNKNYTFKTCMLTGITTVCYKSTNVSVPLNDRALNTITILIWKEITKCKISPRTVNKYIGSVSSKFHPLHDMFRDLPDWDGVDYLQKIVNAIDVTRIVDGTADANTISLRQVFSDWLCNMYLQVLGEDLLYGGSKNFALSFVTNGKGNIDNIRHLITLLAPKVYEAEGYIHTNDSTRKIYNNYFIIQTDPVTNDKAIRNAKMTASIAGCVMRDDAISYCKPEEHVFIYVDNAIFLRNFNVQGLASQIKSLIKTNNN